MAKKQVPPDDAYEDVSHESPYKAKHGCNRDAKLREAGYTILSRPKNGDNLWIKNGKVFHETYLLSFLKSIEPGKPKPTTL